MFLFFLKFVFLKQTKEFLLLSNSYNYVNVLPNMVKQIAISFVDTLNYDQNTTALAALKIHAANSQTLS